MCFNIRKISIVYLAMILMLERFVSLYLIVFKPTNLHQQMLEECIELFRLSIDQTWAGHVTHYGNISQKQTLKLKVCSAVL